MQFLLQTKYRKNRNTVISVSELKTKYFFGIAIKTPEGSKMSDEDIEFYISSGIIELETVLDLKIPLQVHTQKASFLRENHLEWGFIKTNYPVVCVEAVDGFIGTVRQISYPKEWLSVHESNDVLKHRRINIVPNQGSTGQISHNAVFTGTYANLGYFGARTIPNYWNLVYTTGFAEIPSDLSKVIGYKAAIPIYTLLGNLVLGAGIANQSLGLDGLSQSIGTTSSAENSAYSATIKDYQDQLKLIMPTLVTKYKGIGFGAV